MLCRPQPPDSYLTEATTTSRAALHVLSDAPPLAIRNRSAQLPARAGACLCGARRRPRKKKKIPKSTSPSFLHTTPDPPTPAASSRSIASAMLAYSGIPHPTSPSLCLTERPLVRRKK